MRSRRLRSMTGPMSKAARQADVTVRLMRAIIAGCAPTVAEFLSMRRNLRYSVIPDRSRIAIDSPDGLFVPVLRDVANPSPRIGGGRSTAQIGREGTIAGARRVREPTLTLSISAPSRAACRPDHIAAAGGDRRRRAHDRSAVRADPYCDASHATVVRYLRSSGCHRRRGGALFARGHHDLTQALNAEH